MSEYYKLYVLAELSYVNRHKDMNIFDLFPIDWYEIKDYDLKIKIIIDAIKNNILIKDSKLYKEKFMLSL